MRLIDPESARFRWTGGYHKGELKQGHWIPGYYACGFVNSRNRMGGYVGDRSFVIMIDYGRVVFEIVDDSEVGRATATCASAESKGFFPPVADSADPSSPATTQTISASGLTLRAMPEGAYITAVQADSSGALAGLKPGMVITAVNGIALAAMGEAAAKVVGAAGANAMLTLVDGTTRKLGSGQ